MFLGFLKITRRSCIASTHVLIELSELWWLVVSFIIIANWGHYPRPQEVVKKIHFIVQAGKCLSFLKVKLPHNTEKQCVLHFWMIVHTNPIWCSSWTFWKYRCIRSKILLYWSEIWNTSPLKGLLVLTICKIEKKLIQIYFFRWKKCKNSCKKPILDI